MTEPPADRDRITFDSYPLGGCDEARRRHVQAFPAERRGRWSSVPSGGIEGIWGQSSSTTAAIRPVPEIIGSDVASARLTTQLKVHGKLRVPLRQRTPGWPTRDSGATGVPLEQMPKYPQRPTGLETTLAGRPQARSRCCRSQAVEQHGRPLHERLDAVATLLPRCRQHAAQHGEVLRRLRGAERARGLHAQLDHARVLLLSSCS